MRRNKLLPNGIIVMLTNRSRKTVQHLLKKDSKSLEKIALVPSNVTQYMSTYKNYSSRDEFNYLMGLEDKLRRILKDNDNNISGLIKKRKSLLVILRYLKRIAALAGKVSDDLQQKILARLSSLSETISDLRINKSISTDFDLDRILYTKLRIFLLSQSLSLEKN